VSSDVNYFRGTCPWAAVPWVVLRQKEIGAGCMQIVLAVPYELHLRIRDYISIPGHCL